MRRDLTINSMAQDSDGTIIDPFGGQQDLAAGILRHVSPAFAEDPVRILRIARFAARYGFQIADETMSLMRQIGRKRRSGCLGCRTCLAGIGQRLDGEKSAPND